ncbi:transcription termination/antitermination NusG family protein [Domibacillus robiginosus]|uniref:transcription termination/antitermination NusG family protein n=1 Tax=Domibacillus robiginosus TaxID=1071054 RepID=UPI00067E5F9D|nr:transcription termination/antitermination NusG family protein [Domibacillus robiginosus]
MSFFAIQVKSGQEVDAKEMLKSIFYKRKEFQVKGIYALETVTQVLGRELNSENLSDFLDNGDMTAYLHTKRTKENLSNLRAAYAGIDPADDSDETKRMRESYQKEIAQQSEELKNTNYRGRCIQSVLKGYILLELKEDLFEIPKRVWHLINSIPKVIGVVGSYSIPDEEMEQFFEKIDLTPAVEVCAAETEEKSEEEQLHEANMSGTNQETEGDEKHEASVADQLDELKELTDDKSPLQSMFEKCRSFIRGKREILSLPVPLLVYIYKKQHASFGQEIRDSDFVRTFIGRLRLEVSS